MSGAAAIFERFGVTLPASPAAPVAWPQRWTVPAPKKPKPRTRLPAGARIYKWSDALCLHEEKRLRIVGLGTVSGVLERTGGLVEIVSYPGGMTGLGLAPNGKRLLKTIAEGV